MVMINIRVKLLLLNIIRWVACCYATCYCQLLLLYRNFSPNCCMNVPITTQAFNGKSAVKIAFYEFYVLWESKQNMYFRGGFHVFGPTLHIEHAKVGNNITVCKLWFRRHNKHSIRSQTRTCWALSSWNDSTVVLNLILTTAGSQESVSIG